MMRRLFAFIFFPSLFVLSTDAHAQLGWSVFATAELDDSDVSVIVAGVTVEPRAVGWKPIAALSAAWLRVPTDEILTVTPTVGLSRHSLTTLFRITAGYSFTDGEPNLAIPVVAAAAGHEGVVNSAEVAYTSARGFELWTSASYNYGGEAFWGRGRVSQPVRRPLALGVEATLLHGPDYQVTQLGVVIGVRGTPGVVLVVGRKFIDDGAATYLRLDLTYE